MVTVRRSTGNNVRGHYIPQHFPFHFPFFHHLLSSQNDCFSHRRKVKVINKFGFDHFPDPLSHFGAPWQAFWICRQFDVAGGERVHPNQVRGGQMAHRILKTLYLWNQESVGLTSNQAVNLSMSVVLRPIEKNLSVWTMKEPWRALFTKGPLKLA